MPKHFPPLLIPLILVTLTGHMALSGGRVSGSLYALSVGSPELVVGLFMAMFSVLPALAAAEAAASGAAAASLPFLKLAQQYYKYGRGRARTLLKLGKFLSVRPAIPFFMVVGGTVLLATSTLQPVTPFAFGAYALGTAAEAIRVGRKVGWQAVPIVWGIFPTLHVSHGIGFGVGLVKYTLARDWAPEPERLSPRDTDGSALTPEPQAT